MSFPPGTEMFQFPGFASTSYVFRCRYPRGWVAPFGCPRINACSRLPVAFRSVPRPSSPPGAKASTECPSFTCNLNSPPQSLRTHAQNNRGGPPCTDIITMPIHSKIIFTRPEHSPKTIFRSRFSPQSGSDTQDDPDGFPLLPQHDHPDGLLTHHDNRPHRGQKYPRPETHQILFTCQRPTIRSALAAQTDHTTISSRYRILGSHISFLTANRLAC